MKKQRTKRLSMNSDTVRLLRADQMVQVNGGNPFSRRETCTETNITCTSG